MTSVRRKQTQKRLVSLDSYLSPELSRAVENPSPLYTRLLAGGISLLFFGTLTWAAVSKVDVVATAQGEVIPSTRVQPIRALSGGLLQEIHVEEGSQVEAGAPLVQLDPTISEAEFQRLNEQVRLGKENLARLEAERDGKSQAGSELQDRLLASRLQQSQAEINRQRGAIRAAQAELQRLRTNLSHANTKKRSLGMLVTEGAIPHLDYLDVQNQVSSLRAEINTKEQEIYQAQQEAERLIAQRQNEILTELKQQRQELADLQGRLSQAQEQRNREMLEAPVDGTVYNLKIMKAGATVQPGEELLSLVPEGEELVLEAKVLNRDRAFVEPGDKVKVKLETLPYQEFGTLEGKVIKISPNAVDEQESGLVFPAMIQLEQQSVKVKGEDILLTPGMVGSAEIVLRERTILSFLLDPIRKHWDEAISTP